MDGYTAIADGWEKKDMSNAYTPYIFFFDTIKTSLVLGALILTLLSKRS